MTFNYPELKKIKAIVVFAFGVDSYQVRGVKDTPEKLCACYLARKLTNLKDWEIAGYFCIDHGYMNNQIEYMTIDWLVDPEGKEEVDKLCMLYRELEEADNIKS